MPSCMRAPPEVQTAISARLCATAMSHARANCSPAALPSEPPRKPKSMQASTTGTAPTVALATTKVSSSLVRSRACATRDG